MIAVGQWQLPLKISEVLSWKWRKIRHVFGDTFYAEQVLQHPRSQGLTADTALPEALAKTKTGTSKIL
jgi:hypothetical protein